MKCPNCRSANTERHTISWMCLTCGREWPGNHKETAPEDPSPALRDHATGEPGHEAPRPGGSGKSADKSHAEIVSKFGRVRIVLELGDETETIAVSRLIHLHSIMSGEPKEPLALAEDINNAIDEATAQVQRTIKLFGCQAMLEHIKASEEGDPQ